MRRTRATTGLILAAAAALGLIALAGCSDGGADQSASSGGGRASTSRDGTGEQAPAAGPKAPGSTPQARAIPDTKAEVKTATMTVRVANVRRATQRAEDLATAAGGTIAAEETTVDPEHAADTSARLTLRVPNSEFARLLRSLAAVGAVLDQNQSTVDVTSQVVDVDARLASQRESVARVRALLSRATSIADIVRIEAELASRQADLESLEAQQKALADRTAQATVTVSFIEKSAAAISDKGERGFLVGLRNGWDAFTGAVAVGLTALGAALPFLVLAGVITVPVLLVWRSRSDRRRNPVEPEGA
jgi:hypothetical protein